MKIKRNSYNLKTLVITMLMFAIVSIGAIGTYSTIVITDSLAHSTETSALSHLKSSDSLFYEKTKNIQRFADTLNISENLWEILNNPEKHDQFNSFMKKNIQSFEDIEACIMINNSGKAFVYNLPTFNDDHLIQLQVSCRQISEKNSLLHWYNTSQSELIEPIFDKYVLCGTSIFNEMPAKLYIFVKTDTFSNITDNVQTSTIISILDEEGRLIISNNEKGFSELFYTQSNNLIDLYSSQQGVFRFENKNQNYVAIHYQSGLNSFKFAEIHKESQFYRGSYKIIIFMLSIIVLFTSVMMVLYLLLAKQFLLPLKALGKIMKDFDDNSLGTQIEIVGNNEISSLASCFNRMVKKINEIIENVKEKDEEKKRVELIALRRQIQPHFIYNTLNSIRILAMYNSQDKIASSLQILARMLKKAFSAKDTFSTVKEDIEFIRDYIFLIQICYKNSIDVSYHIEPDTENIVIPGMLIQPLIENAIQHGLNIKVTERNSPAKLYISVQKSEDNKLLIEITDNGVGMNEEQVKKILSSESATVGSNVGIKNIRERIHLLCGEEYGLNITSEPGRHTTVSMTLPIITERQDKTNN